MPKTRTGLRVAEACCVLALTLAAMYTAAHLLGRWEEATCLVLAHLAFWCKAGGMLAAAVFPVQPIEFGCTCSAEKVERAVYQYSARDLEQMTNDAGVLTADCQFCGAHYAFDPSTLGFEADPDRATEDGPPM
ncbi:MAG: Hsp33 family molecular chaperone HslO [Pseudomonadota bacterium]